MDILTVILRTTFFYIFVIIVFRLMGKREIGELSIQDLAVGILITELVAIAIENYNDSIFLTIVPILVLLIFEIVMGFLSLKFNKFRNLVDGKPSLIINKGKVNYKEMLKQRYSLDDLLLELRNNGIKDLKDVEYAVLENTGKLNLFEYNFLKLNTDGPFPLILDGHIQKDNLKYINKSIAWLNHYLLKNNLSEDDVFYAFYKNNKVYFLKKDDLEY